VIDLQEASSRLNELGVEVVTAVAAAPAISTPNIVVPDTQRWIIWRVNANHSDNVAHFQKIQLSQAATFLTLVTPVSLPANVEQVATGPFIAEPGSELRNILTAALNVGSVFVGAFITRFALDVTVPQVNTTY
jgi:hypothetical protein